MKYMKFLHMRRSRPIGPYVLIITMALIAIFVAWGIYAMRTDAPAGDGSLQKVPGTGSEVSVDGVRLPEGEKERVEQLRAAIRGFDLARVNEILS